MSAPLVSVIMPTYNRTTLLARALRSVATQTFRDVEVIVVDDGSTEDLTPALQEIDGLPLQVLRHDHQRGPAAARNTAVAHARGRYLAFLDSDDEWLSTKLEQQVAFHQEAPHRLVSTTAYFRRRNPEDPWARSSPVTEMSQEDFVWGCACCPGSTLMIERSSFARVGPFNETLRRLEDWDWVLRCIRRFEFHVVDAPLARIYGSTSSSSVDYVLSALRQMETRKAEYGISWQRPLHWLKFKSTVLVEHSATHYRAGNNGRACVFGGLSVLVYPFRKRQFYGRALGAAWDVVRGRAGA